MTERLRKEERRRARLRLNLFECCAQLFIRLCRRDSDTRILVGTYWNEEEERGGVVCIGRAVLLLFSIPRNRFAKIHLRSFFWKKQHFAPFSFVGGGGGSIRWYQVPLLMPTVVSRFEIVEDTICHGRAVVGNGRRGITLCFQTGPNNNALGAHQGFGLRTEKFGRVWRNPPTLDWQPCLYTSEQVWWNTSKKNKGTHQSIQCWGGSCIERGWQTNVTSSYSSLLAPLIFHPLDHYTVGIVLLCQLGPFIPLADWVRLWT